MSAMETNWHVGKLIDTYGQSVKIHRHTFTLDDDNQVVDESYYDTISTRAWIIPFGGLREIWDIVGYRVDGDYSGCFKSNIDIDVNDRVILNDGIETEVVEIIKHYELNTVAYKEVILRKTSTGV